MNCFYHAWTYGSDGALNGLPGEEGYGPTFDRATMSLLSPAKVDSYRGFVFACFDPGAVDLRTYLAGAADYIDLVADQAEALEIVPGRTSTRRTPTGSCSWRTASTATTCCRCTPPTSSTSRSPRATGRTSAASTRPIDLGNGHAAVRFRGPWARPVARWTPSSESTTAIGSTPHTPSWSASTGRSGPI